MPTRSSATASASIPTTPSDPIPFHRKEALPVKRIAALLCVLALTLTGCSSMLERDYVSVTRHVEYPVNDDSSILQAESYQGLVSALLYFVSEHAETGVIHLSNYVGDVGSDLDAACREVMEEDPFGAFALKSIVHSHTRIVSYYEVSLTFEYARSAAELDSIVPISSLRPLSGVLTAAMTRFDERCAVSLSLFTGDEASLLTQIRQLWLDTPLASPARPDVRVKLYPDSGLSRVAEFTFDWGEEPDDLSAYSSELLSAAQRLLQDLNLPIGELTAETLLSVLPQRVVFDPAGGFSAYDALVNGTANAQGMASALCLLCHLTGAEATVVEGRRNGEPAFWLISATPDGYRHLDPTADAPFCAVDEEFRALGYEWSMERYPSCVLPSPPTE